MNEKRWISVILILFLLLGWLYSLVTPAFEASDELWHYPMVRHLADGNPLPVQVFDPALAGPWKQEASQPPLYYWMGAALTFWIDTSDMAQVRQENPHVDNGLITQDGNRNLVVHNPSANPWQGTLLALRIVRFFSVILGAITVYLTYLIARKVHPKRSEIALGAAAATAFLPMFLFISGSVNNDNLAIMLSSLALFLMIRLFGKSRTKPIGFLDWLIMGSVIGLGLLTKEGTIGLLPLAWGTALIVVWQDERRLEKAQTGESSSTLRWLLRLIIKSLPPFLIAFIPVLIIAGWWYYRNIQLYGDWLGWSAFIAVLGQRGHPASLAQLWGERHGFLMSYWGLFGGVNLPMPAWIYVIFNGLLLLSIAGFIYFFIRLIWRWVHNNWERTRSLRTLIDNLLRFTADNFALVTCLLFAAAVIFGLIQWATTTWSSQGRLVFTALSSLSILFVTGLIGWLPQRASGLMASLIAIFFFLTAAAAPFLWISPHYQPAEYSPPRPYVLHPQNTIFGDTLRLKSVSVDRGPDSNLHPGDPLWVHLQWETLQDMEKDWSVFVHLIDPILGQPIAQRDMYPGQGLLLTSWLDPGQTLVNSYQLHIPQTAIAPAQLDLAVGLYHYPTGERLETSNGNDSAVIAKVNLEPVDGLAPNSVQVNFENELQLTGFEIEPRRLSAGEIIDLTLYWQSLRSLEENYTIFAQVLGQDTTRWASFDLNPDGGTSNWMPGETQPLSLRLTIDENAPPGLYPLIVGLYTQDEQGNFNRLQILTEDGRLTDDFLELTQIRID